MRKFLLELEERQLGRKISDDRPGETVEGYFGE